VWTIQGVFWSGVGQFGIQAFGFLVSVLLARLLSPHDYGLVTATSLLTGLFNCLGASALTTVLVQWTDLTGQDLDTSFWAGLAVGSAMAFLLVAGGEYAAVFFREPLIAPLLRVQAVGLVLTPLGIVHSALLLRNMEFRSLAMVDLGTVGLSGVLAIGMALTGWGVWSLVVPSILGTALGTIVLWRQMPWRARRRMAWGSLRVLARSSLSVQLFNVLNYVRGNVDYLVIGRALGPQSLGLYYLAYTLATIPQTRLVPIATRVLFPALSAVRDDPRRVQTGYTRAVQYTSLVTFPLLTGLAILAPEFVLAVFGARWANAAPLVRILCIAGLLYAVGTTTGSILFSQGRADLACWFGVGGAALVTGCVLIGARSGAMGVATAVAAYALISFLPIQLLTNRLIDLGLGDFLRTLIPAASSSVMMTMGLLLGKLVWEATAGASPFVVLLVLVPLGAAVYLGTLRLAFPGVLATLLGVVRQAAGAGRAASGAC
jgi:PST family polysaccharide transporter